jgi:hypothetical protein
MANGSLRNSRKVIVPSIVRRWPIVPFVGNQGSADSSLLIASFDLTII